MRIVRTMAAGLTMAAAASGAWATDRPSHDVKVEKAAAERVAARLGGLRGGLAHDAGLAALIERDRVRTSTQPVRPRRRGLPPIVMDAPQGVDLTLTGATAPDGVDPIITGKNR